MEAMKRYFISVSYDGVGYHGSQIQGILDTVQLRLNKALSLLLKTNIETYGASRTDEGVHALDNVYHFDAASIDMSKLIYQLNAILPPNLSVNAIREPASGLDANCRFDAVSRAYRYHLHFRKNPFLHKRSYYYPYLLEKESLVESAAILMNYKDFTTFSKRNTQSYTNDCTISQSYWEEQESGLSYVVVANRFLRGMVRALVGTQLQVARGRYDMQEFIRRIEARDCTLADFSVPGHGLFLEKISYPKDYFLY